MSPLAFAVAALLALPLGASLARGQGELVATRDAPPAPAELELRAGAAYRSDTVQTPLLDARATGTTPTSVSGGARAFGERWGGAAFASIERFGLEPREPIATMGPLRATQVEVGALALMRTRVGSVQLDGGAGYGWTRVPLAARSDEGLEVIATDAHGPLLAARARVPLGARVDLDVGARARPLALPGTYGGADLGLRSFAGHTSLAFALGRLGTGGPRVSAVAAYEIARTTGEANDVTVVGTQHRFALGLRAALGHPAPAAPAPARADTPRGPDAPPRRLLGVVRTAGPGGAPIAGADVALQIEGGARTTTDARGSFEIAAPPEGLLRVRVSAPRHEPTVEVVSIATRGDARMAITLHGSSAPATVTGLVRARDGRRIKATITVVETGDVVLADARGAFTVRVPPGAYTLLVEAPGCAAQRKTVRLTPGEQSIYNIDLRRDSAR